MNLQFIYKKSSQISHKLRVRKFKNRLKSNSHVKQASYRISKAEMGPYHGFQLKDSCRIGFKTFLAVERATLSTKEKISIRYSKYPNSFVTKKSSHARMGKGKGKITGRVLKIKKNEILFNTKFHNILKNRKWIKAIKCTLPVTAKLVRCNESVAKVSDNFFRLRPIVRHAKKRKRKRRRMQKKKKKGPTSCTATYLRKGFFL